MSKIAKSIMLSLVIVLLIPVSAAASGGYYTYTPLKSTSEKKTTATKKVEKPCKSLTQPYITPKIDGQDPIPSTSGVYVIDQQDWVANWEAKDYSPVSVSYIFEVSSSTNTDPITGKFTGPIIYTYSGTNKQSDIININFGETQYFHIIVVSKGYCNTYSKTEQISADQRRSEPVGAIAPRNDNNISGPIATVSTIMMLVAIFGLASREVLSNTSLKLYSPAK